MVTRELVGCGHHLRLHFLELFVVFLLHAFKIVCLADQIVFEFLQHRLEEGVVYRGLLLAIRYLVHLVDVLEGFYHLRGHQIVQHLVVLLAVGQTFGEEFIGGALVEIIVEPGEPEPTQAVAHQIQEGLDIVVGVHNVGVGELSVRSEHRIPFELLVLFVVRRGPESLCISEIDQVVIIVSDADVVKFDVLVYESDIVELLQRAEDLDAHVNHTLLEFECMREFLRLHVAHPGFVEVHAAVGSQDLGFLQVEIEGEPQQLRNAARLLLILTQYQL